MKPEDLDEARLARLLGATRATPDPAVLARARARLSARATAPGVAVWLGRPAVLAGAGVLFALCLAGTFAVSQRQAASTGETSLAVAVLGDDDLGLPVDSGAGTGGGATGDSGGVTP